MLKFCQHFVRFSAFSSSKFLPVKELRRHLFSPAPLGLLDFATQQNVWREKLGHKKGEFLQRLKKTADDGDRIFTEDVTALLHLADNDEEFNLAFEVIERYKALQEKQSFKTFYPVGDNVLQMLYRYGKHDMAFKWFLDEKFNVETSCRNRHCFLLMMDLLYENERFEDVLFLLTLADTYFDKKYPEHVTLALTSLYRMNTKDSLKQMLTILNELCTDPIQLTNRCASVCSMLAYKQGELDLMLEILQLPLFTVSSRKIISSLPNIKILAYIELGRLEEAVDILKNAVIKFQKPILAYIELGRLEEAVDILKNAVIKFQKPVNLFFDEVLEKLISALKKSGNVELESLCITMHRTLKAAGFIFPKSMDEHLLGVIRYKEYEIMMTTDNPMKMYNSLRTVSDKLALNETKLIT